MSLVEIAKNFTKVELPDSEVELAGEIPAEELSAYETQALVHIGEGLELPGFRKGQVPADMVRKRVGDVALLEEAVELCLQDLYPTLLDTHQVDAVGRPDVRITKLAPGLPAQAGNPVTISITATVYPSVTVPQDWKSLAGKIEMESVPDVLDAELDEALESIRKAHAKAHVAEGSAGQSTTVEEKLADVPADALPPLDDAFAQSLGQFANLEDLKTKLRDNMKSEKEQKAKDARRGKLIDALLEKTDVAIPRIFVDSELEKILAQMKEDVSRFGLSFEDYLKQVGKTEEAVREDFREQARKRAKLQLALNKLAQDEKIEADPEAVATEMQHATEHFPDARPDLLRIHIETVLRNEQTLRALEGLPIEAPSTKDAHADHDHSDPNHTH